MTFDIREVFPYLRAFRDRTFVISVSSVLLLEKRVGLIEDFMLLATSGIRLILIIDEYTWLKNKIDNPEKPLPYSHWQLSNEQWPTIAGELAYRYFTIQAALAQTIQRHNLNRQFLHIHSGSYVRARPRGVFNGRDLAHNAAVRHINHSLLQDHLRTYGIVLVPGLAPSSSGSLHWVAAEEMAANIAVAIKAKKWLHISTRPLSSYFSEEYLQRLSLTQPPTTLTNTQVQQILSPPTTPSESSVPFDETSLIWHNVHAAVSQGVARVHFIHNEPQHHDNGLLAELFTHRGSGIMITSKNLEVLRSGKVDDIAAILSLLAPLEEDGTLIPRSYEHLERDIEHFLVLLYDNRLIGCAALLPIEEHCAELSCMTVSADCQRQGYGTLLLNAIFERAQQYHYHKIFLLTTRTHEWFEEHGFMTVQLDELPTKRRDLYNTHRNAKIMMYHKKS